ncbi:MAG: TlpA family protein disulfide reductase [Roseibacillus sp.]
MPAASPSGIPEKEIAALQKELAEAGEGSSTSRKRRAYKSVVRDGYALLKVSPEAPERWRVLDIVFQSQKRLLILENSGSNREAILETCGKLAEAPDEVADLRLEADLLLSERELSLKNADVKERARALAELIARYRDTPGEVKSLMMASQIAPKLEAFDLETQILRSMQERFADHHGIIEFRRKSLSAGRIEALFRGTFTRTDGTSLSFPIDRLGHPCIMVFWSKKTQGFEVALKQINEHQEQFPDRFDFYSLNLDELPDGGEATLRSLGLDWTVMRLPGGKKSQTFRTYGRREPVSVLVNAYGYTLLTPTNNYGRGHGGAVNPYKFDAVRITDDRYLAQLQSLFIGDFLVADSADSKSEGLTASLRAIQNCFVAAPFRYRLTRKEALANYKKAAQLCGEAIAQYPQDQDLWRVRNRRIIALLGMWKLAGEPKHHREAAEESRSMLVNPLPKEADVVARFCLAKEMLRARDADAKSILSDLIDATGRSEALGSALAAAAILALDANSRELHDHYREILLEKHAADPTLWPVVVFLRDRYHTLDLLKVKLSRGERRIRSRYGDLVSPRGHAINHGLDPMIRRLPDITLKTLDGGTLTLPKDTENKLTLLLFVEPPADPEAAFPVVLDGQGRPTKNDPLRNVMGYAFEFAERHIHQEVEVIAAFLSDDAEQVRALMEKNEWPCRAALVPGGLNNPMVRQLGILSADRIPNVFLLRRDGTIAWHTSGFSYKSDFGYPFAIRLAMKVHIEVCDTELAYQSLGRGDFEKAKSVFSGPFLPEKDERYGWRAPRFHGRALANMGLKDWEAALADIDEAIEAHRKDFDHAKEHTCDSMVDMQRTRAATLEKLGRSAEAKVAQQSATIPSANYPTTQYELFHRKLEKLRQKQR